MAGAISCSGSSTFVLSDERIHFPVIVVTCICVLCGLTIGSGPCRVSLFHTITLSEFYIICICDVVLVLCLPMLSLTVVLRVLGKVFSV